MTHADGTVDPVLVIDGSKQPWLLPDYSVWENLFVGLHSMVGRRGQFDASDAESAAFVRATLHLTDDDIAAFLPALAEGWSRIQAAKETRNQAFRSRASRAAITEQGRQLKRTILVERDALLARLSPQGAKALLRFEAVVRQGLILEYTQEALEQERLEGEQP